jgi:hypothetical protein
MQGYNACGMLTNRDYGPSHTTTERGINAEATRFSSV